MNQYCKKYMLSWDTTKPWPGMKCITNGGENKCECRPNTPISKEMSTSIGKKICEETNLYRQRYNKRALQWDQALHDIAYDHAQLQWQSHQKTDHALGGGLAARKAKYASIAGNPNELVSENLRRGTQNKFEEGADAVAKWCVDPGKSMHGWAASTAGHNENMMKATHTHCGAAVFTDVKLDKVGKDPHYYGDCAQFYVTELYAQAKGGASQ